MRQIASPSILATESTCNCGISRSGAIGMLLVTITASNSPGSARRSRAGGENTGWVAQAITRLAPRLRSKRAPWVIVPPVSIMSSINTAVLPATSPITVRLSATLWPERRLSMIARGASCICLAKARARATPPTSGDTTTTSPRSRAIR